MLVICVCFHEQNAKSHYRDTAEGRITLGCPSSNANVCRKPCKERKKPIETMLRILSLHKNIIYINIYVCIFRVFRMVRAYTSTCINI